MSPLGDTATSSTSGPGDPKVGPVSSARTRPSKWRARSCQSEAAMASSLFSRTRSAIRSARVAIAAWSIGRSVIGRGPVGGWLVGWQGQDLPGGRPVSGQGTALDPLADGVGADPGRDRCRRNRHRAVVGRGSVGRFRLVALVERWEFGEVGVGSVHGRGSSPTRGRGARGDWQLAMRDGEHELATGHLPLCPI